MEIFKKLWRKNSFNSKFVHDVNYNCQPKFGCDHSGGLAGCRLERTDSECHQDVSDISAGKTSPIFWFSISYKNQKQLAYIARKCFRAEKCIDGKSRVDWQDVLVLWESGCHDEKWLKRQFVQNENGRDLSRAGNRWCRSDWRCQICKARYWECSENPNARSKHRIQNKQEGRKNLFWANLKNTQPQIPITTVFLLCNNNNDKDVF